MRSMKWKVELESGESPVPVRGGPVNSTTLVVELGPMEIRTFLLKFQVNDESAVDSFICSKCKMKLFAGFKNHFNSG